MRSLITIVSITFMTLIGTSRANSEDFGAGVDPCPASPNCVSSTDLENDHYVAPFELVRGKPGAWDSVRSTVSSLPRTRIVAESGHYIHAECRSRIFGFVDDLELALDGASLVVSVRSASRLGYSDFGVNRKRIERLRRELLELEIIRN